MKNSIIYKSILSLVILVSMLSCGKNESKDDTEKPGIQILSPTTGESYLSGDTLPIHIVVSDNDELHDISAELTRTHNGSTIGVWDVMTHSHEQEFHIEDEYVIVVPGANSIFELTVTASDHNGNENTLTYSFQVAQ
jgi:hypothetical protein